MSSITFCFGFCALSSCAQGPHLALGGPHLVLGGQHHQHLVLLWIRPGLAMCKESALPLYGLSDPGVKTFDL